MSRALVAKAALALGVALLPLWATAPAEADVACAVGSTSCTVSFSVAASSVSLSTTAVGSSTTSAADGSAVDIALGTSIVTASISASGWHVDATASNFTSGATTITKSHASFSVPNAPTAPTLGVLCPTAKLTTRTAPTPVDATTGTVTDIVQCTAAGVTGATYTPVLRVTIPAGAVAGTYTGTVTQSAY